ncbi:hypothetical protein DL240_02700 [Lujinxingia litoralis]|uniref:DUF2231 domain-containing protein n=1 Tax=Lujinxingia litoralis TaxID=2211119 RepID=A0A328CBZ9_9DELT|nr:hypothetical protein [Lujinxingia litoralis]RAL25140.1 hypothetical protein DL240_02700 [Lujinxingia litoralis]
MENLFFHPEIVHIPIALAVLMPLLTAGLLLAWWQNWLPRRAWWIALSFQLILVGSGYLATESGEKDEDVVERIVDHDAIEAHEEAAETFMTAAIAVLIVFLAAGLIPKQSVAIAFGGLALVGTLVVFGLGYQAGQAGGALVYEHGAANAFIQAPSSPGTSPRGETEEH